MGRGDSNSAWIKTGKGSAKVIALPAHKRALGYSPALETASGAGAHGGGKKRRARADRRDVKSKLRRGDFE